MHIRFTEEELATLAEMLTLARYVASWNVKESADQGVARFDAFTSKILEKAVGAGMSQFIEREPEMGGFQIKKDLEENFFYHECYEEFRNESFWDELAVRLADKDLARAIGQEAWEQLDEDERRRKSKRWESRYWEEFAENGLDRVAVIAPSDEG